MANGKIPKSAVDGAYAAGIEMLDRGEPPATVERKLQEMGVPPDDAKGIVASYGRATEQVQSAGGKSEMMQGGILLGVSLLVVVYASGSIVGWIGLVAGAIQLFRGWKLSAKA